MIGTRLDTRAFALSLVFVVLIGPAGAGVVGLDDRSGSTVVAGTLATDDNYDELRAAITSRGHSIVPLSAFEAVDLAGLDALILRQALTVAEELAPTEIDAIQAFAAAGHGFLVMGEGGFSSNVTRVNLNTLVAPYGIEYHPNPSDGFGRTVEPVIPHALTTGVDAFRVDFQRRLQSIEPPAIDLTGSDNFDDALALVEAGGGTGNLVFMTDSSVWNDSDVLAADATIASEDNAQLLDNILAAIVGGAAECFLVLGSAPGDAPWSFAPWGHVFPTLVGEVESWYPVRMEDVPEFVLHDPSSVGLDRLVPFGTDASPTRRRLRFLAAQVVMWNPDAFPSQPERTTHGLLVRIEPDGTVESTPYGAAQGGMSIWTETETNAQGQLVLRFRFSIGG